jgi:hypothetical protein
MRRIFAALVLVLCTGLAAHAGEGVYVTLEGGYGTWNTDDFRTRLDSQNLGNDPVTGIKNSSLLIDRQMPAGGTFGLRLGYNIGGHVAVEGNVTVRPYDLFQDTRGGAGIAGLTARWFPLQGFVRPGRPFDISLNVGMDYVLSGGNGIHGPIPGAAATSPAASSDKLANTGRGFDGVAAEFGVTAELYLTKGISIGLTPRMYVIDPIRYFVDFDNRNNGGAIPLGGNGTIKFYSLTLGLTFHFEAAPD